MARTSKSTILERLQIQRLMNLGRAKDIVLRQAHTGFVLGVAFCYGSVKTWIRVKENFPLVSRAFSKSDVLKWVREECPRCFDGIHHVLNSDLIACQSFRDRLKRTGCPILIVDRSRCGTFWVGVFDYCESVRFVVVHFTMSKSPFSAVEHWKTHHEHRFGIPAPIILLDSSSDLLIQDVNKIRTAFHLDVQQHPFGVTLLFQQIVERAVHVVGRTLIKNPHMNERQVENLVNSRTDLSKFLNKK